jgi:hypothetical protein
MKIVKCILYWILCGLLSLLICISVYDIYIIKPTIDNAMKVLDSCFRLKLKDHDAAFGLLLYSESYGNIRRFVVANLMTKRKGDKHGVLWHHIENGLWNLLIGLHLKPEDMYILWFFLVHYQYVEAGPHLSDEHIVCQIDELTDYDLAKMIIVARKPGYFKAYPNEIEARVSRLLESYKAKGK